jgi:hypothetical protein
MQLYYINICSIPFYHHSSTSEGQIGLGIYLSTYLFIYLSIYLFTYTTKPLMLQSEKL